VLLVVELADGQDRTAISDDLTATRPSVLAVLRKRAEWSRAVESLLKLFATKGDAARKAAAEYGEVYRGLRGAMVFDVVASRQRRYEPRVLPLVKRWKSDASSPSLEWLAANPPETGRYGLRRGEAATMAAVAGNLRRLAVDLGVSEDVACRTWADSVDGLEHAPGLDPIVGSVKGIGPALFAYMRMRAGGDALKADLRVTRGLRLLGFEVPGGVHATLVIARAVAEEIGTSLLVLDQLLWGLDDRWD
jgi:hypothetical protein